MSYFEDLINEGRFYDVPIIVKKKALSFIEDTKIHIKSIGGDGFSSVIRVITKEGNLIDFMEYNSEAIVLVDFDYNTFNDKSPIYGLTHGSIMYLLIFGKTYTDEHINIINAIGNVEMGNGIMLVKEDGVKLTREILENGQSLAAK